MAILRATFTAFVDQGVSGDSLPVELEWNSTTAVYSINPNVTVAGGAGTALVIPAGSTLTIVIPPAANTITWTINGVGAGPIEPATGATVLRTPTAATLVSTGLAIPGFTVIYL